MNVTSQNWGYLNAFAHEMYKLGRGINDTNYVVWSSPLWYTSGPYGDILRREWYGLTWEPAEHAGHDRTWSPRDELIMVVQFSSKASWHGANIDGRCQLSALRARHGRHASKSCQGSRLGRAGQLRSHTVVDQLEDALC